MDFFTKSQLKERGWSDRSIISFLGDPDLERPNPACASGPKGKLYEVSRVFEAESSSAFRAWWVMIQSRREAQSKQAILRKERRSSLASHRHG